MDTMRDAVLGEITTSEDELVYRVRAGACLVSVSIFLEGASFEEGIAAGRRLYAMLDRMVLPASEKATEEFIPLINGAYHEPGRPKVSADEFRRRAELAAIDADPDGNVWFHYRDDDMLWGHWMTVTYDAGRDDWRAHFSG